MQLAMLAMVIIIASVRIVVIVIVLGIVLGLVQAIVREILVAS